MTSTITAAPVPSPARSDLAREVGVFGGDELDAAISFFAEHGFVTLRGLFDDDALALLEIELVARQRDLVDGRLPERCGTVILDDPDAAVDGEPFAHYVCHVTEVSTVAREAAHHPPITDVMTRLLGPSRWLLEDDRFGVVYQDARPGAESGYSRIGWHSDAQSGPNLDVWPSVAFTIHIDATSPQNGFLRVLPGSHLGGTDGMPPGFEKVPGERAVYCDRGDVLLHHSDLWHSAARATDDGPAAVRRHLRGGWYGGTRLDPGHGVADFVKNARR
jgi:ectoine hydroxylase-related dioxygenase (phytanoyl-CoA dioxygenase family)